MTRPLSFHEGLTIVVGWDKGFVKEPGTSDLIGQFLASNWPHLSSACLYSCSCSGCGTRAGATRAVGPVAVQYAPPEGMSPAEAGTLVDENAAMRDITATIVDLAVRGYIVIEEKEKSEMMGLLHNKEYVFHLKKGLAGMDRPEGARDWLLLAGIFSNGAQTDVDLSSLQNEFYKNLPGIKNGIFDALMERGYFQHRPDYVRSGFVGGGIAAGVLLFFMGNALSQKMGMAPAPFFVAAILSAWNHRRIWMVHAGAHGRRGKSPGGRAGLRGFSDSRRSRSHGPDQPDSGNIREVSAVRDGAGRGKEMGRRIPEYLFAAALVVPGRLLQRRILSDHVRQQPGQHDRCARVR